MSDRIVKPKPVAATSKAQAKTGNEKTGGANKKGPAGGRSRNANRRKPKTADELDAEMTDYFGATTNGTATDGGNVQATNTNGGDAMEDEIMVDIEARSRPKLSLTPRQ